MTEQAAGNVRLERPEAILFDMDGTLLQTETLLMEAHGRIFAALREEGLYAEPEPPVEALLGCLGMLLEDIWLKLMPTASEAARERANELLLQFELEELAAGKGVLYEGVTETLAELRARGIRLFVASNGLQPYVEGIVRHKRLEPLFDGLYTAGGRGTATKAELVRLLLAEHGVARAWMVGDRSSDVDAGKRNGLPVVGCDYADFGASSELDGADVRIRRFGELLELLGE
ncbi:HAD family hydrolase [Paenibacillus pasadenensis]|uniref:Phosphoglycolate phosphatase n=1 Tax=Paenibacillus pasadenensis TaxID=217090 RepID=A0A2N5N9P0_9BACL|nr:HAD family hydrolase [Paenibacillus pasadenensis]PLT47043.1 Phosphoglycolate phosphatase [Paenibacillus pasadenensis]